MSISLTRDEFYNRLSDRSELFGIAIKRDLDEIFPLSFKTKAQLQPSQSDINTNIDITPSIIDLLMKEIHRIIDLVYEENLD